MSSNNYELDVLELATNTVLNSYSGIEDAVKKYNERCQNKEHNDPNLFVLDVYDRNMMLISTNELVDARKKRRLQPEDIDGVFVTRLNKGYLVLCRSFFTLPISVSRIATLVLETIAIKERALEREGEI